MKNIFRYLESYSRLPLEVDELIVSAFIKINGLKVANNLLLKRYSISKKQVKKSESLSKFINIIQREIDVFDIEKLIELFEFVISPSDRIVNGAVYTPIDIRAYIVSQTFRREG